MPNGAKTVLNCSDQSTQAGGRRPATQDLVWSEIAGDCNLGLSGHKLDTSTPVCHWYNVHYSCVCLGGGITKFTQIAWHKVTSDVCIVPWDWQSGSSTQIIDLCFHSRASSAGSGWSQSATLLQHSCWRKILEQTITGERNPNGS